MAFCDTMPRSPTITTCARAEALAHALHGGQESQTVRGIALEHRDGHRAAARVGEQPVVDLQRAGPAIAAVAALGQRAGAALEVARRQVIQHQRALAQVACGELLLDRVLARQQPIHGRIQIVLVGIGHTEVFSQGRAVPAPGGGQLGVGLDDARGHHGQHQIALTAGLRSEHRSKAQALHGQRRRPAHDHGRENARPRRHGTGSNEGLALQRAPDDVDQRIGQMRQIAQGLVLDLAVLAVAAPQQVGAVDLVLVGATRGDDVSGAGASWHAMNCEPYSAKRQYILVTTSVGMKKAPKGQILEA
jgi:hypothetical protein